MTVQSWDELPHCQQLGYITFAPCFLVSCMPWAYLFYKVPLRHGVPLLERVHTYFQMSRMGLIVEIISAVLSVISCVTYVASTYLEENTPTWFFPLEVGFSVFFMIYFGFTLLIERNKLQYLTSLQSFVDISTVLPVLITLFLGWCDVSFKFFAFARVLKFARVLRLLRAMRSFELLTDAADDAIRKQTMRLISLVVIILVVSTGFIQYLANENGEVWNGVIVKCQFESHVQCQNFCNDECSILTVTASDSIEQTEYSVCKIQPGDPLPEDGENVHCTNAMMFHDALYFVIVTFSTVGYGDVSAVSTLSRSAIVIMIAFTFFAIPAQSQKLQALRLLRSEYDGTFRKATGRPHVVLCCGARVDVRPFIAEFFHEDHSMKSMTASQLVLLMDCLPSNDLRETMLKYGSRQRLVFFRGDGSRSVDMGRVRADLATAVFLLSDRTAENQDSEDQITVLRALTARRINPQIKIYAQMLQPENIPIIINAGVKRQDVMCVNQMRLGLLGAATSCPGLPAMLLNLVQSISWRQSLAVSTWHQEYCEGMMMEVYSFQVKPELVGAKFGDLVKMLKRDAEVVLFAVSSPPPADLQGPSTRRASGVHSQPRVVMDKKSGRPTSHVFSKLKRGNTWKDLDFLAEDHDAGEHIELNPGVNYCIQPTDTLFALADEASSLDNYIMPAQIKRSELEAMRQRLMNLVPQAPSGVQDRALIERVGSARVLIGKEGAAQHFGRQFTTPAMSWWPFAKTSDPQESTAEPKLAREEARPSNGHHDRPSAKAPNSNQVAPEPATAHADIANGTTAGPMMFAEPGSLNPEEIGSVQAQQAVEDTPNLLAKAETRDHWQPHAVRQDGAEAKGCYRAAAQQAHELGLGRRSDSPGAQAQAAASEPRAPAPRASSSRREASPPPPSRLRGASPFLPRAGAASSPASVAGHHPVHLEPLPSLTHPPRSASPARMPRVASSGTAASSGGGSARRAEQHLHATELKPLPSAPVDLAGMTRSVLLKSASMVHHHQAPGTDQAMMPSPRQSMHSPGAVESPLSPSASSAYSRAHSGRHTHRHPTPKEVKMSLAALLSALEIEYGDDGQRASKHVKAIVESLEHGEEIPDPEKDLYDYLVHEVPPMLADHIIVVCETMDDMQYLLAPIHSHSEAPATVFVCSNMPSMREWEEACVFKETWVLQSNEKLAVSTQLADSSVVLGILCAHAATKSHDHVRLIAELSQGGFSRKLARRLHGEDKNEKNVESADLDMDIEASNLVKGINQLESSYIAGCTVVTSLLDLLVCQQYFNPYIVALMNIFLLGRQHEPESEASNKMKPAVVYRPVPVYFEGKTFGDLFSDTLTTCGEIVVGLYRMSSEDGSSDGQHYVVTNPSNRLILRTGDHMYVIEFVKNPRLHARSTNGRRKSDASEATTH